MTAAKQAKAAGLKSLTQVSKIVNKSLQTLGNWYKHQPALFEVVLLGCKAKLDNEFRALLRERVKYLERGDSHER